MFANIARPIISAKYSSKGSILVDMLSPLQTNDV